MGGPGQREVPHQHSARPGSLSRPTQTILENELKLLTVEQLCELLQVKKDWVYDHVRAGDIPYIRVGNLLRFREDAINDWLTKNSSDTVF